MPNGVAARRPGVRSELPTAGDTVHPPTLREAAPTHREIDQLVP
jgi:hypothetical protein